MFEGEKGAWEWFAGGTFTAAFNWQNNIYKGANLPTNAGADYLRANFSGGGISSIAYTASGGGATGGGAAAPVSQASVSVVQVPPSPLITQVFPVGQSNTTNSARHEFTFAPIGEWRIGGRYRISQSISFNFGYTGMWMSQIARASTNTKFLTAIRSAPRASRNRTATQNPTTGAFEGGQTAVVDGNNNFRFFEPNGGTGPLPPGFQRVPPTVPIVTSSGGVQVVDRVVRNQQEYVEYETTAYTQQTPNSGANEYVLTNGIDFGFEIKY